MTQDSELIRLLDEFAAAWNSGDGPPSIAAFLDSQRVPDSVRRTATAELLKLDLEERWQRGLRRLVEDYGPDIADLALLITPDLVLEEFRIRKCAGDDVSASEYAKRFPHLREAMGEVFRLDPAISRSMTLAGAVQGLPEFQAGDRVDDFDLLAQLGRGAFADVFLARQRSMQRIVAVKVSTDEGTEPQTLAQLDHDHIIRVYDQRRLTDPPARLLYMQYAAGGTLQGALDRLRERPAGEWSGAELVRAIDSVLDARGEAKSPDAPQRAKLRSLTWPQVVCLLGSQLARGLDYAHRAGVLHRDLKPANILLMADGTPKLADFNISFGAGVEGDAADRNFGGSLAYMSPEQLEVCHPARLRQAADLDGRSDQYALGVVLLELLSGQKPFRHQGAATSFAGEVDHLLDARRAPPGPRALAALRAGESCGLSQVLLRMLAASRDERYPSCAAAASALELCLQPDARRLLTVEPESWRERVQQWPVVSVVSATLVPNAVAAVFNFLYNRNEIRLQLPAAEPTFMRVQSAINLVAFPVGIACVAWLIRSVTHRASAGASAGPESRRQALQLGAKASVVGLTLWLIAAPVYPVLLHRLQGSVPAAIYAHFVASLVLCGLIAAAYPFLFVSLIALRCLLPGRLREATLTPGDRVSLARLSRQSWVALTLAAAVPMLAVLILALSGLDRRQALVALAAAGTLGFGLAVTAFRLVQRDVQVLLGLPNARSDE